MSPVLLLNVICCLRDERPCSASRNILASFAESVSFAFSRNSVQVKRASQIRTCSSERWTPEIPFRMSSIILIRFFEGHCCAARNMSRYSCSVESRLYPAAAMRQERVGFDCLQAKLVAAGVSRSKERRGERPYLHDMFLIIHNNNNNNNINNNTVE